MAWIQNNGLKLDDFVDFGNVQRNQTDIFVQISNNISSQHQITKKTQEEWLERNAKRIRMDWKEKNHKESLTWKNREWGCHRVSGCCGMSSFDVSNRTRNQFPSNEVAHATSGNLGVHHDSFTCNCSWKALSDSVLTEISSPVKRRTMRLMYVVPVQGKSFQGLKRGQKRS